MNERQQMHQPGSRIDKYELASRLGEGAMGEVWLARDVTLDRQVALKLLLPQLCADENLVQRFIREARAAAKLDHINCARIHSIGKSSGQVYLDMEFLSGGSIDEELNRCTRIPWRQATRIVLDGARGLRAAHEAGIVHRDIKPSNLMRSHKGVTKVVDFGLALAADQDVRITQAGVIMGTPAYMSPEQCRSEDTDARSDIYALACTFYKIVTGQLPFPGRGLAALIHSHTHDPFPDPREGVDDIPDAICRILARGAQKNPNDRYQSVEAMIVELEDALREPEKSMVFGTHWGELQPKTTYDDVLPDKAEVMGDAHDPEATIDGKRTVSTYGLTATEAIIKADSAVEFRITISPYAGAGYPVLVDSPLKHGNPSGLMELGLNDPEFQRQIKTISDDRASQQFMEEFGAELWQKLLTDDQQIALVRSSAKHPVLRIVFRVLAEELRQIPWEMLFSSTQKHWLCTDPSYPISRHVDATKVRKQQMELPLRVMVCIAQPNDLPRVTATMEMISIKKALEGLRERKLVEIFECQGVTRETLQSGLSRFKPHVFHYIGHGSQRGSVCGLLLEQATGTSDFVQSQYLTELLGRTKSVSAAILNACETEGVASSLAEQGIASVGMLYEVRVQAAVRFCKALYKQLVNGAPLDMAVNISRSDLRMSAVDRVDWCAPAVYLPAGTASVFDMRRKPLKVEIQSRPQDAHIMLDGRDTGRLTPNFVEIEAAGQHQVAVVKTGYESPMPRTLDSTSTGEKTSVIFDLQPQMGSLIIQTDRPNVPIDLLNATGERTHLGVTFANGQLGPVELPVGQYAVEAYFASGGFSGEASARVDHVTIRRGDAVRIGLGRPAGQGGFGWAKIVIVLVIFLLLGVGIWWAISQGWFGVGN